MIRRLPGRGIPEFGVLVLGEGISTDHMEADRVHVLQLDLPDELDGGRDGELGIVPYRHVLEERAFHLERYRLAAEALQVEHLVEMLRQAVPTLKGLGRTSDSFLRQDRGEKAVAGPVGTAQALPVGQLSVPRLAEAVVRNDRQGEGVAQLLPTVNLIPLVGSGESGDGALG